VIDSPAYDLAIVGAGPIGIELAVAARRAGLRHVQFDARQVGYTISWFAPQTRFFSSNERIAIAGVPLHTPDQAKASREEYLAYLRGVVRQFDLRVRSYEPVTDVHHSEDGFVLSSAPRGVPEPRQTRAGAVVLATGGTDRPHRLNIPGEDLPHVSHYFHDPHTYFDQRLLVVGGKNSAVEAALRCHHAWARVSLSYRRAQLPEKSIKYWLMPEIAGLIASGRVPAHFETVPVAITPAAVTLRRADGSTFDVPADFVLLLVGYEQDNTLLKRAGVELAGSALAPVFDPATMQTNVPGLYVAGTAVGGTQDRFTVFIENCHVHVDRIIAHLTGRPTDAPAPEFAAPES
jgi:thioredoxin reductase (NADPH)